MVNYIFVMTEQTPKLFSIKTLLPLPFSPDNKDIWFCYTDDFHGHGVTATRAQFLVVVRHYYANSIGMSHTVCLLVMFRNLATL